MSQENYQVEILEQSTGDYELSFKIIIIGDSNVGKSCLTLRGTKNIFEPLYAPTIGFEFIAFYVKIDGKIIKMQIWDTCGQEVYRSLISSFYNNSSLAIMVYSIDNEDSFNNLEFWLNEIRTKANPDINIFLIGNKCDLEDKRRVTKDSGQEFSQDNKFNFFMETSAKTGFNAQNLFIEASRLLYDQHVRNRDRYTGTSVSFENFPDKDKFKNLPYDDTDESSQKRKKGCC